MSYVLFVSGCPHHCKGCHNPETWDYNFGESIDIKDVLKDIEEEMPIIKCVTFSGGEPFEQPQALRYLANRIKEKLKLKLWCYTGYTLEQLKEKHNEDIDALLGYIDVLVDGPYIEELKDSSLKYKGSSNQRIIDLKSGDTIDF